MKYKIGERVRIKNLDWYNENKDIEGDIPCSCNVLFLAENKKYLGTTQTIETIYICEGQYVGNYIYKLKGIENTDWTDEMIECKVEEKTENLTDVSIINDQFTVTYGPPSMNDSISKNYKDLLLPKDQDDKLATEMSYYGAKFIAPDGFLIGKTTKIDESILVEFVKKKSTYPTSYEECCKILGILTNSKDMTYCGENVSYEYSLSKKMHNIRKLHICRDAFYKIYGEEIGLGTFWKPDWTDSYQKKYTITVYQNKITLSSGPNVNKFLTFPTMEMRDIFYETFKNIIEEVKELL